MANVIRGVHLTLDGETRNTAKFSKENLTSLIGALVKALEMDIIFGPVFKEVELDPSKLTGDAFIDEGGLSAMCMISTSHISIHCWPLRGQFMFDAFSCKEFDVDHAKTLVREYLHADRMKSHVVSRDFT